MRFDLVQRDLALGALLFNLARVVLVPVAFLDLGLFIDCVQGFQLFLCGKDRVSAPLCDELFCINVIDRPALTLAIGAVDALIRDFSVLADHRTFVKPDSVVGKCFDQSFGRTFDFALGVGILNAQIKHAAALVGKPLADGGREEPAEMHKAGRTRRKTGYLGTFRKYPGRVFELHIFRRFGNVREEKLGERFEIKFCHHKMIILSWIRR